MKNKQFLLFSVFLAIVITGCTATTDTKVGTGTGVVNSSTSTTNGTISTLTATLDASTGCVTNVNTAMDSSLPSWIKDNFKCQVAYVSGTNYVFKSVNLPNHTSYYYCGSSSTNGTFAGTNCSSKGTLYTALTSPNYGAGTNVVKTQNFVYTIPITPTVKSGTLTGTQAGYSSIGITTNGLAIFNNAAAAPDVLADEANTFDQMGGHPQNTGNYHHHAYTYKLSPTMATATLVGIAIDGYAIYDEYCDLGTGAGLFKPTANATAPTGNSSAVTGDTTTTLDQLHGHTTTTKHFTTATYHYHYMQDTTATIKSLMSGYFKGTAGTVSN